MTMACLRTHVRVCVRVCVCVRARICKRAQCSLSIHAITRTPTGMHVHVRSSHTRIHTDSPCPCACRGGRVGGGGSGGCHAASNHCGKHVYILCTIASVGAPRGRRRKRHQRRLNARAGRMLFPEAVQHLLHLRGVCMGHRLSVPVLPLDTRHGARRENQPHALLGLAHVHLAACTRMGTGMARRAVGDGRVRVRAWGYVSVDVCAHGYGRARASFAWQRAIARQSDQTTASWARAEP